LVVCRQPDSFWAYNSTSENVRSGNADKSAEAARGEKLWHVQMLSAIQCNPSRVKISSVEPRFVLTTHNKANNLTTDHNYESVLSKTDKASGNVNNTSCIQRT